MSSLVAELLQTSGKLAKENIVLKVNDLKYKLEAIKCDVQETMKNTYSDFLPQYVKLDKFLSRLRTVSNDYEYLHNQIEKEIKPQIGNSVAEFHDTLEDLKKIKVLKEIVHKLVILNQHLQGAKNTKRHSDYLSASYLLIDFETVFKEIDSKDTNDIAILNELKVESVVTKQNIIYEIENIWKQNVVISDKMNGRNKKCVTISIKKENISYDNLLKSLYILRCLRPVLKKFGMQFLKLVCEVLILNHVKVSTEKISCTIDILNEQCPRPSEVFENLKIVFLYLYRELFSLEVSDDDNLKITAMSELGAVISDDFYSLIIDKCLKVVIPTQSKELEAFNKEVGAAENFCNDLLSVGFCSKSSNSLLNFIKNVDVLPVTKMTQDVLSKARSLMQKSLHQTVSYGVKSTPIVESENPHDLSEMTPAKSGLSKATFLFPRCQISVSVKELVKLLTEIKEEAKHIGHNHAPRLYYVARNICELYCCVVPTFHKEGIQNIPQQTAIFHNNCMYLAHEICILGSQYECDLQAHIPLTFVDLVPEIKKLGTEAFLHQMRHQKQLLLQLIQEQQAFQTIMIDEELVNKAEKSVKQCLCQLQLLKKVWSDVLPSEIYFKAIGTLFNSCLEEIILRVLSMEDISADVAAQMDSTFSILLKQGPDLFKIEDIDKRNFVHLYVKRWFKFQELQLVLGASMKEIVDRWASGKGPLATHFTSDDVKHLIRALFQNTERRAAALAKIR